MASVLCTILMVLALGKTPQQCLVGDAPWFCHDLDCPPYDVVKTFGEDSELRSYPEGG